MPRTIQCKNCNVVLNLPAHVAAGKRLKCPRCATRFVVTETDASSVSTVPGMTDAALTSFDMEKRPPSVDDLPLPTSEGNLRETFDLPLVSGREAEGSGAMSNSATADAASLFTDQGPKRRHTAAEARAKARRCSHCGSGVPSGMSICQVCGTDQETGLRVGLDDDLSPAPPPRPQGPPLHVAIVGGICGTTGIILALMGVIQSTRGQSSLENYAWLVLALVSGFGIYGCVQFLRGKSAKPLMLALALGVAVNVIGLVAFPLLQPILGDPEKNIVRDNKVQELDDSDLAMIPFEQRIDSGKIKLGIGVSLIYAMLSLYLMSPPVKKFLFQSRSDRFP